MPEGRVARAKVIKCDLAPHLLQRRDETNGLADILKSGCFSNLDQQAPGDIGAAGDP